MFCETVFLRVILQQNQMFRKQNKQYFKFSGKSMQSKIIIKLWIIIVCYLDPCKTNNGGCSTDATCTRVGEERVKCSCNVGFIGDGQNCEKEGEILIFILLTDFN